MIDIVNIIKDYIYDLKDIINICNMNQVYRTNLYITNLYDIDTSVMVKMNQNTIEQEKFKHIEKLYIFDNKMVHNLNHLKSLKILNCGSMYDNCKTIRITEQIKDMLCDDKYKFINNFDSYKYKLKELFGYFDKGINQQSISELELEELYCDDNVNITNVNHMKKKLKVLSCCGICGIDQHGISELNLKEFICDGNVKINSVNHMGKTLEILKCRINQYINKNQSQNMLGQSGIIGVTNLIELYIGGNKNICNLNHMKNSLKVLDCSYNNHYYFKSGLTQDGISELKLESLCLCGSKYIYSLNHMQETLKYLKLYYWPVDISELRLSKLVISYHYNDQNIYPKISLNNMKDTLKHLELDCEELADQDCISELRLDSLCINYKNTITNLNHMKDTLKILECYECYNLTQNSISDLQLEELTIFEQCGINNFNHMKNTLKKLKINWTCHEISSINQLQLENLSFCNNDKLKNIDVFHETLKKLSCDRSSLEKNDLSKFKLNKLKLRTGREEYIRVKPKPSEYYIQFSDIQKYEYKY